MKGVELAQMGFACLSCDLNSVSKVVITEDS